MKHRIELIVIFVEVMWSRLLQYFFNIQKDISVIPKDIPYCYTPDIEKNAKKDDDDYGYYIKICPYFRSTKETGGIACTFVGYYGFDFGLYDTCKICGVSDGFDDIVLEEIKIKYNKMNLKNEIRKIVIYMLPDGTDSDVIENYVDTFELIFDEYSKRKNKQKN